MSTTPTVNSSQTPLPTAQNDGSVGSQVKVVIVNRGVSNPTVQPTHANYQGAHPDYQPTNTCHQDSNTEDPSTCSTATTANHQDNPTSDQAPRVSLPAIGTDIPASFGVAGNCNIKSMTMTTSFEDPHVNLSEDLKGIPSSLKDSTEDTTSDMGDNGAVGGKRDAKLTANLNEVNKAKRVVKVAKRNASINRKRVVNVNLTPYYGPPNPAPFSGLPYQPPYYGHVPVPRGKAPGRLTSAPSSKSKGTADAKGRLGHASTLAKGYFQHPGELMPFLFPTSNLVAMLNVEEDQACVKKIQQLKKYTVFVQHKIAQAGHVGNHDKKVKMEKLLEILTNYPRQQVSMDILLKCEAALQKMERDAAIAAGLPPPKNDCQKFEDVVLSSIKNDSWRDTLFEEIGKPMEELTGQPLTTSPVPEPEYIPPDSEHDNEIPGVLRRELNVFDERYKASVIRNSNSEFNIMLNVSLMFSRLPRVPPLKIFIPKDYPEQNPALLDLPTSYGSSSFLNAVLETLKAGLLQLPKRYTVLQLLRCWELSVRHASNPKYKPVADYQGFFSGDALALAFL